MNRPRFPLIATMVAAVLVALAALAAFGTLAARGTLAATAGATAATTTAGATAGIQARYALSVPSLEIAKTERVKSFELEVKGGLIRGIPRIPAPWKVELENEDGKAWLKAVSRSGTAEVKTAFFGDFVEVELWDGAEVRLRVTTTEDWVKVARRLTFEDPEIARRKL